MYSDSRLRTRATAPLYSNKRSNFFLKARVLIEATTDLCVLKCETGFDLSGFSVSGVLPPARVTTLISATHRKGARLFVLNT